MHTLLVVVALMLLQTVQPAPQSIGDVEYIAGQPGFPKRLIGRLVLDEHTVSFVASRVTNNGQVRPGTMPTFSLPLATVAKVTASVEGARADPTITALFGVWGLATSVRDEYVYLQTETPAGAEVVLFKVKKLAAPGIAAKVDFAARHAKVHAERTIQ